MPTWLKVLLIVGGMFVVLVIAVTVAGVYLGSKYLPRFTKAVEQASNEGKEYGHRTDNEGCLNEAVARHARADGIGDLFNNILFLNTCLVASRPTPGFCDNVPRQLEFSRSVQWQLDQCKRYGLSPEKQCGQLFQQVQQFCESPHIRSYGDYNSNETDANSNYEPLPPLPAPWQTTNTR